MAIFVSFCVHRSKISDTVGDYFDPSYQTIAHKTNVSLGSCLLIHGYVFLRGFSYRLVYVLCPQVTLLPGKFAQQIAVSAIIPHRWAINSVFDPV